MKRILWSLLLVSLLITAGCSPKSTSNVQSQPSTQSVQLPSVPQSPSATPSMSFRWVDLNTDILNPKGLTTDGKPDGHFHVTMPFGEPTKIKYIIVRYAEFGKHVQWAWQYNTTVAIVGSPMTVFDNGVLVVQGTDTGLASSGITDLDFYISELNNENGRDTFKFEKGQTLSIQIKYITKSGSEKEFNSTTVVTM